MKRLFSTFTSENGAIAIVYVIIFPFLLAATAVALDGSMILKRKARLADASSEAVLAIAAIDNRLIDDAARNVNDKIINEYIGFYFPSRAIENVSLGVTMTDNVDEDGYVDYKINITADFKTLLPLANIGFPAFGEKVSIGNQDNNSGNARKFITTNSVPADYVFVVDFSATMNIAYTGSDGLATNRLNMLKTVVNDVISGSQHTDSQFALVPFDLGVPFRAKDAVNNTLPYRNEKNEAGGELVGCSTLYVPKVKFSSDNIDYDFWANKHIVHKSYSELDRNRSAIFYNFDRSRYLYYRFIVGESLGETIEGLEKRSWCVLNQQANPLAGRYMFSCEKDPTRSIFTPTNQNIIDEQYAAVIALIETMRGKLSFERSSIANSETIDYAATLDDDNIFNTDNVQEFIQPWAPNMYEYRAFSGMCQSATKLITVGQGVTQDYAEKEMAKTLDSAKPSAFLIPLTTNKIEKEALVNNLMQMQAGGGTDSTSGLLRSVPIIASGMNKKKVIIVISDGEDEADPAIVAEEFHARGMCDVIKSGLKSESLYQKNKIGTVADVVEIHYVSINDDITNAERMAFWGRYCAKGDSDTDSTQYVHTATNYSSLLSTLKSIIGVETGYYIRDDQQ